MRLSRSQTRCITAAKTQATSGLAPPVLPAFPVRPTKTFLWWKVNTLFMYLLTKTFNLGRACGGGGSLRPCEGWRGRQRGPDGRRPASRT